MKGFQQKGGILTFGNKIVYHGLPYSIPYSQLCSVFETQTRRKRPEGYYQDMILNLLETIGQVIDNKYQKSGFSGTSALTSGSHTHFRKNPDNIYADGNKTCIKTSRLLNCGSGRYHNNEYDIDRLLKCKNEIQRLLSCK